MENGVTSLLDASSLIVYRLVYNKVVDIIVKYSICKLCKYWETKKGFSEYEEFKARHELNCPVNYTRFAGKTEINGTVEMFSRSEKFYRVKYLNYIGDGDSKTYQDILDHMVTNLMLLKKNALQTY